MYEKVESIKLAVISSYCLDEDWIFEKLRTVPRVIVVSHWDRMSEKVGTYTHPYWKNVTIVHPPFPKFPSYGVMHSKLLLLFSVDRLRIAISTGNLVSYDYNEVQNAIFVQDLKKMQTTPTSPVTCQFYQELKNLLERFSVKNLKPYDLEDYDWSKVKAILIQSDPGSHYPSRSTGLTQLKRQSLPIAAKYKISSRPKIGFEYQCSSIGNFTDQWLGEIIDSITAGHCKSFENLKIIFPSERLVHSSPLGPGAFGTIFSKRKDWESSKAPKKQFYDCLGQGRLEARPLHTKILTVIDESEDRPLYYYIGSSNFTQSAWGRYIKDGQQLMVCNFELGLLLDASDYPVPWPYKRPAPAYKVATDRPWAQ